MFCSDGGRATSSPTAKHRPLAWPAPWYGSWPSITTLTLSNGHKSKALKMFFGGGYTAPFLYSSLTKAVSVAKYSLPNSSSSTFFHVGSIFTSIIVYRLLQEVIQLFGRGRRGCSRLFCRRCAPRGGTEFFRHNYAPSAFLPPARRAGCRRAPPPVCRSWSCHAEYAPQFYIPFQKSGFVLPFSYFCNTAPTACRYRQ